MKFYEILTFLMEDKEISLKGLAEKTQISLSTLYGIMELKHLPTLKIAIELCNYFDCSIDYILGISDKIEKPTTYTTDKFVTNYKNLLVSRGVAHTKVCKDLNIGRSRFYDWQRGKLPYLSTIITLANYFKISVDELIG